MMRVYVKGVSKYNHAYAENIERSEGCCRMEEENLSFIYMYAGKLGKTSC